MLNRSLMIVIAIVTSFGFALPASAHCSTHGLGSWQFPQSRQQGQWCENSQPQMYYPQRRQWSSEQRFIVIPDQERQVQESYEVQQNFEFHWNEWHEEWHTEVEDDQE